VIEVTDVGYRVDQGAANRVSNSRFFKSYVLTESSRR
jgi:hypothetical protein